MRLDIKLNVTMYRDGLGINRDNASDIADSYVFANVLQLLQERLLISSFFLLYDKFDLLINYGTFCISIIYI